MNGITILYTELCGVTDSGWPLIFLLAIAGLFVAVGILSDDCCCCSRAVGWVSLGVCVASIVTYIIVAVNYVPHYEYKVTLSPTTQISEVTQHYDIIGQEGQIYHIRDKK